MSALTMPRAGGSPGRGGSRVLRGASLVVAIVLQTVVLVPFTVASGLLAPLWAVVVLHVLWLLAALALWRTARHRPFAAPLVPVLNAAVLWAAGTAGDTWLGWTG